MDPILKFLDIIQPHLTPGQAEDKAVEQEIDAIQEARRNNEK